MFNGRVGEDEMIGKETTIHNPIVDYVIRSPFLLTIVQHFKILDFDPLFSDIHCGITFCIKKTNESLV